MSYQKAILAIGAGTINSAAAVVVREQARIAANTPVNLGMRYFGYVRKVGVETPVIENQDNSVSINEWYSNWKRQNVIWAGYFDNQTKKLVADTLGTGAGQSYADAPAVPAPSQPAEKKGPGMGLILGIAAGGVGLMLAMKK